MRLVLLLTLGLCVATAAHAQYAPYAPIAPIEPPKNPYALPKAQTFQPYKPPAPYQPTVGQSVYADGPFSPGGEARRERKAEAAERARANGAFSPAGEAKRRRAEAKREAEINPY